jgi:15-cis-phytoene synthase
VLLPSPRSGARADQTLLEARETTERVARTFALACRLLPRDVRDDVYRLYLVFRTLDDLVDDGIPGALDRVAAVEAWCREEPGSDGLSRETRVLADLARRFDLPRWAMADFCAGMRDDLTGTAVTTEADLDRYCYRVAGTVGIVMTALLGVRPGVAQADAHAAASALGCAMQRTNILRDIDEDLAAGRVYLAAETVERLGPLTPGSREALLRDQIGRADVLYEQGLEGAALLARGRFAIRAAGRMYREILRQIEREGYGREAGRAVVPTRRKIAVAARAGVRA